MADSTIHGNENSQVAVRSDLNSIEESGVEPAQQMNNQVNGGVIVIDGMADLTIHGNENSSVEVRSDLNSIADAEPAQQMNNQVNGVVILINVIRLILIAINSIFLIQNDGQKTATWKDSIKNILPFGRNNEVNF